MRNIRRVIAGTPVIGQVLLFIYRAKIAIPYFFNPLLYLFKWLFRSRETTNFTYDLEDSNKRYLASLIADVTGVEFSVVLNYIKELEEDTALRNHINDTTAKSSYAFMADRQMYFGRRAGWYALVRIVKPQVIIETGVDKGLGSCVLAAALRKNKEEGSKGRYYGTDINPDAGYLLSGEYADFGKILYGDSITSLKLLDETVDLFINDSDHSSDYEAEEYKVIASKLSDKAILLGDNSDSTDKLLEFSLQANRHFVYFQEKPLHHWFPGAGIGISFTR